jgi:hypothetical protein
VYTVCEEVAFWGFLKIFTNLPSESGSWYDLAEKQANPLWATNRLTGSKIGYLAHIDDRFQHPEGYTHHDSNAGAEDISRLAYAAIAHCGVIRPAYLIDAVLGG